MAETHFRTCPLCEATCGIAVTVEGTTIKRIAGDADDVFSAGFICPKGATLKALHEDPDRLRAPVVRRGGDPDTAEWETVGWDEAFAEVEHGLMSVLEGGSRDAVGIYLGNPNAHHVANLIYGRPLVKALGTKNVFSASTVDQMPKHVSCGLMFGDPLAIPVPDLDRTDFLLMLGANPWESNGSLCTAPDFPGRLERIQKRGGKFVVVDPRRTRTAEKADEHVPIRPGTDAELLLGLIHVVFAERLERLGQLAEHVSDFERLRALAEPFTLERVSMRTGIAAGTITRLARSLAQTERAAVYGRIGTHTVRHGTIAAWAVDALNAVTGNLDVPGGAMWPLPAHVARGSGTGRGFRTGRHKSRVKGYPEVRGELPVVTLADEIETPGDGQIRAMVTVAGNPVVSAPDGRRLERALGSLDFMVSVDIYRNETTRLANVILPPPPLFTRSQYELAFFGLSVRNVAKWSPALFDAESPPEEDILARLALIASGQGAGADPGFVHQLVEYTLLQRAIAGDASLQGRDPTEMAATLEGKGPIDRAVEIMIRSGAYGDLFGAKPDGLNLSVLREHPHGVDLGPLEPRIPELLGTPSGKIELAPDAIATAVEALVAEAPGGSGSELLLVGRRHLRSNNSWMHNVHVLVRGKDRCTLQVHPTDAERLGLRGDGRAKIASRVGELEVSVEVTDRVMPGVVSLPHGWGHDRPGTQMRVAREHAGVNSNVLTDGSEMDPLSGNAVLNGIPVTVAPL